MTTPIIELASWTAWSVSSVNSEARLFDSRASVFDTHRLHHEQAGCVNRIALALIAAKST